MKEKNTHIRTTHIKKKTHFKLITATVCIFLLMSALAGFAIYYMYYVESTALSTIYRQDEENQLEVVKEHLQADIKDVEADLKYLSASPYLLEYLNGQKGSLKELDKEFLSFSKAKRKYDQIRFLDLNGNEKARVNFNAGAPSIVPEDKLQNKSQQYYFPQIISLDKNEIYASPLDLNKENGIVEVPHKPTIRFGSPVFDKKGKKRGAIVLNYLACFLLDKVKADSLTLLTSQGNWLEGDEEKNWSFMFDKKSQTFKEYYPSYWEEMTRADSGQIQEGTKLLSFSKVKPMKFSQQKGKMGKYLENYHWYLLSTAEGSIFKALLNQLKNEFIFLYIGLLFLFGAICLYMAKLIMKIENADERFRLLFSNSTDPHFVLSRTGAVIDCNDAALEILNAPNKMRLTGIKMSSFAPEKQPDGEMSLKKIDKMWETAQKSGYVRFDIFMRKFDGKELPLEVTLTTVSRSKKKLMLSVWHDLTGRNKAELEVRKSEQRLNAAQKIAKLGNWQLEVASGKLWWSREVYDQCGLDPEKDPPEFKKYLELLHPEDLNNFVDTIEKAIETGKGFDFEYRVILPDGKIRHVHAIGKSSIDENGKTVSITGTSQDITDRKEAEVELKNAKDKLERLNTDLQEMNRQLEENIKKSNKLAMEAEQANKAKSEFLANVSHEIRTPMNAILGFSEIMESLTKDPLQQEYLTAIKNSGKSLLTLINDILDLSKVEAGKLSLEYSAFHPANAIREVCLIFSRKIEEKELDLTIDIAPDLPDGILLDETRFRQILLNLLSNAVKFTEKGSVRISAKPENISNAKFDFVFSVEDTGIGIPEEQKEKIFGAFEQQEGQSHAKFGGTGLGLTITQRLTHIMNGDITAESSPGKGSKFTVRLHEVEITKPDTPLSESGRFQPTKVVFEEADVLAMGSDKESRDILKGFLSIYPEIKCREAKNQEDAIEMIAEKCPDAILVDVKMRDAGELEFLRKLKSSDNWKNIPVIAATASVKKESETKLREICEAFLRKPITRKGLVLELMRHLKHSFEKEKATTEELINSFTENDMTQIKAPDNLLALLTKELQENYPVLQEEMMMNKIEEFGARLKDMAEKHNAHFLEKYASELMKMVDSFNIVKLPELMKQFPEIVNKMQISMEKN